MLLCDRNVREKANQAPLYIPTRGVDFQLLFEPALFDPYYTYREDFLTAADFYKYNTDSQERKIVLEIARQRMQEHSNGPGFAPPLILDSQNQNQNQ